MDVNVDSQVLLDTWSRGGSRSPQLTAATKEVFHLVSGRNIQLTLYKVPSKGNIADLPSRHLSPSDSKLSLQSWKRIQEAFGGETGHTLDFMALDSNAQPDFEGSPLPHFTPSPHLSPRESICLHKILSLGRGRRTVTFFPFPPRTFLLVSKGLKVISKSRKRLLQVTSGGSKFATLPPPPSPLQVCFVFQITGPETALVTYGAASRVKKEKTKR